MEEILIVEDNQVVADSIAQTLEWDGFSVRVANNAVVALRDLEIFENIRLIFLDLMLPIMGGYEFLEQKLSMEKIKDIPVIVFTAMRDYDVERLNGGQIQGFLRKPMTAADLIKTAEKYVLRRQDPPQ